MAPMGMFCIEGEIIMPTEKEKTNKETAAHIREFMRTQHKRRHWAWPTDGCGYNQHIRFVGFRNRWLTTASSEGDTETYEQMVEKYCIMLEQEEK